MRSRNLKCPKLEKIPIFRIKAYNSPAQRHRATNPLVPDELPKTGSATKRLSRKLYNQ